MDIANHADGPFTVALRRQQQPPLVERSALAAGPGVMRCMRLSAVTASQVVDKLTNCIEPLGFGVVGSLLILYSFPALLVVLILRKTETNIQLMP
ncbi:MAG: hypothetical protein QHJ34_15105 [bacterium]|nr:hypothetical protein [candidate division KSB1 bacterium]MDH7561530.1 hypothetical protein [bacterium]